MEELTVGQWADKNADRILAALRVADEVPYLRERAINERELLCNVDGHDFLEMVNSRRCRKCGLLRCDAVRTAVDIDYEKHG